MSKIYQIFVVIFIVFAASGCGNSGEQINIAVIPIDSPGEIVAKFFQILSEDSIEKTADIRQIINFDAAFPNLKNLENQELRNQIKSDPRFSTIQPNVYDIVSEEVAHNIAIVSVQITVDGSVLSQVYRLIRKEFTWQIVDIQ